MMRNQLLTGYILHQKPYGETRSLIYLFSKELGIVHGVGKKNLPLFVPIEVFANGKGSLKTFSQSQVLQNHFSLKGQSLFAGMYLNEILQKLLPVEEPFIALWQAYEHSLTMMAQLFGQDACQQDMSYLKWYLRRFETVLFNELGYGFDFEKDALADSIQPLQRYQYQLQQGFVPLLALDEADDKAAMIVTGEQLVIWQQWLQNDTVFREWLEENSAFAKALLNVMTVIHRRLIDSLLNYQLLQSRVLWQQLTQYQ